MAQPEQSHGDQDSDYSEEEFDIDDYNRPVIQTDADQEVIVDQEFNAMRAKVMESVYVFRLYTTKTDRQGNTSCDVAASGRCVQRPVGAPERPGPKKCDFYQVYENTPDNVYALEETRNQGLTNENDYYIRIPSALHLRSPTYDEPEERLYFETTLRWQYGIHMWIASNLTLNFAEAYVQLMDDPTECQYLMPKGSRKISCMYPCYDPTSGTMILGLLQYGNVQGRPLQRTFHRNKGRADTERNYIQNLTEDLVDIANEQRVKSFPPYSMAFYVCNGARLVVVDGLAQVRVRKHTRSLMQQGSVVVVHNGRLDIEICVRRHIVEDQEQKGTAGRNRGRRRGSGRAIEQSQGLNRIYPDVQWRHAFHPQSGTFRERHYTIHTTNEEVNNDPEERGRTVSHWNKKVLFLGAVESQCNTAVWGLYLYENGHCHLKFSDGCVLQDVAPWNTGWKLIRARHLFERSYESCFGPTPPNARQLSARLPFEVPAEQYIFKRMLGIEGNRKMSAHCPQVMNLPQVYTDAHWTITSETDDNVRRMLSYRYKLAFDYHTKALTEDIHIDEHSMRMAPPPLYPPILQTNPDNTEKLVYSRKDFWIQKLSYNLIGSEVYSDGTRYQVSRLPQPEYEWVKIDNVHPDEWYDPNCYEDMRFGDDYCWYRRDGNEPIGETEVYCLKELVDDEDEGAIGASQEDQQQEVDPYVEAEEVQTQDVEPEVEAEEEEVGEWQDVGGQKKKPKKKKKNWSSRS